MKHGSLFSGIGGFDLAAQWMGWENVFHCEWNEFGQKILKYYWPNAISYTDITKTDFTIHRGAIDILTGGFPCQPYSQAGKRLGKEDDRHLWPEMLRAIREIQPQWIVGENVLGLVNWNGGLVFNEVQTDLEAEGYEVQPYVLPAVSVNAPHRRDRIWFVAYSDKIGSRCRRTDSKGKKENTAIRTNIYKQVDGLSNKRIAPYSHQLHGNRSGFCSGTVPQQQKARVFGDIGNWSNWPTVSPICNGNDGLSSQLDGITFSKWRTESLKAGGNAIVPQVAHQIFKAIKTTTT